MFPWSQKSPIGQHCSTACIWVYLDGVSIDRVLLANAFRYATFMFYLAQQANSGIGEYLAQENQSLQQISSISITDTHPHNSQESDTSRVTSSLSVLQCIVRNSEDEV